MTNSKLNEFHKSCLQKVLAYNVKSIAFCYVAIGIPGFSQRKAAKMAKPMSDFG